MLVYSKKILLFLHEIKCLVREVLSNEVRLKVGRDRFYDRRQRASYPIHIVIYNNKSMLGYFDSAFYELGFHECLMHTRKEQLHHVIRHELAHYITFIECGETSQPHGEEFKAFCRRMRWDEEISRASVCLDEAQNASQVEESNIFRKVQKLMALAQSGNHNEAEQACLKSRQLLLKYNIESKYLGDEEEEKVYLKRILKEKRENAKMRCIAKILETFFVSTVYRRTEAFTYLEIVGNAVNVDIAGYVADVLLGELDKLWTIAQKQNHLKGQIAKNSFFVGLAKGYCNKVQALKRDYDQELSTALLVIEKKLTEAKAMAYGRLAAMHSNAHVCRESSALGEKMGRQLNIHPAVDKPPKKSNMLLLNFDSNP